MSSLEEDLKKAKELIENNGYYRNEKELFNMIYPFTTENIKDMLSCFDLKDKACLTVLGASDQVFDMYLMGAKSVTAFDVNPLAKYLFYLKKAGIEALTKEEYLDYFCYVKYHRNFCHYDSSSFSNKAFSKETFEKIVPFLKGDAYKFWTELYNSYDGLKVRKCRHLFSPDENMRSTLENTIYYLDDKAFEKVKEISPSIKITFVNKNIKDLILSKNYDFMHFSNLIQYASSLFSNQNFYEIMFKKTTYEEKIMLLQRFRDLIMKYKDNLNDNGVMIIGYIYSIFKEDDNIAIFDKKIRDEVFPNDKYSYKYFNSTSRLEDDNLSDDSNYEKDACLVYRKN